MQIIEDGKNALVTLGANGRVLDSVLDWINWTGNRASASSTFPACLSETDAFLELRKWSDIYLITRDKMEESATNQRLEPDFLATSRRGDAEICELNHRF